MLFGREWATGLVIGAALLITAPLWGWDGKGIVRQMSQMKLGFCILAACAVGLALEAIWLS